MLWLSKNAIRNNHYLGELAALAVLEDFFCQKGASWLKKELEHEIPRQFYSDGVNEEQSIRHHKFSLEFLLLAHAFLDLQVPVDFWERSGEFLLGVMRADGSWPSIGDDDLGCVIRFHEESLKGDYRAVLSCFAILTGRGDFKEAAGKLYLEAELLFPRAEEKWSQIQSRERDSVFLFPQGGFSGFHNDKDGQGLLVKFGPYKWHAHADLFHLELWHRNQPILVDCGPYRYNNVPEQRRVFRSTPAHNTLVFQGRDQTRHLMTFGWGFPAKVLDWCFHEMDAGFSFTASHEGYKRKGSSIKALCL